MKYSLNDLTIPSMTVDIGVYQTKDIPEGVLRKFKSAMSTSTTFRVEVENYPIVILGCHVMKVSFTLYGMEWKDDDYYGCSLVSPDQFWEYISISTENGFVDMNEVDNWLSTEIQNRIKEVIDAETMNPIVYDILVRSFDRKERNKRRFV